MGLGRQHPLARGSCPQNDSGQQQGGWDSRLGDSARLLGLGGQRPASPWVEPPAQRSFFIEETPLKAGPGGQGVLQPAGHPLVVSLCPGCPPWGFLITKTSKVFLEENHFFFFLFLFLKNLPLLFPSPGRAFEAHACSGWLKSLFFCNTCVLPWVPSVPPEPWCCSGTPRTPSREPGAGLCPPCPGLSPARGRVWLAGGKRCLSKPCPRARAGSAGRNGLFLIRRLPKNGFGMEPSATAARGLPRSSVAAQPLPGCPTASPPSSTPSGHPAPCKGQAVILCSWHPAPPAASFEAKTPFSLTHQ